MKKCIPCTPQFYYINLGYTKWHGHERLRSQHKTCKNHAAISCIFQTLKQNTEVREEENRTRILPPKREISTQTPLATVGIDK